MFGDVTFRTGASQKKSHRHGCFPPGLPCGDASPTRRRARARARIRVAAEHGDHDAIRRRAAPRARRSRGRAGRVTPHGRGFGGPAATDPASRARRRAHLLLRRIRRARAHRLPHVRPMERISGRDGNVRRRRGARDPRSGRRPRAGVVIVVPHALVLRAPAAAAAASFAARATISPTTSVRWTPARSSRLSWTLSPKPSARTFSSFSTARRSCPTSSSRSSASSPRASPPTRTAPAPHTWIRSSRSSTS